jgi:NAD(P)-dependent dehydrogenase (short-subunit alcohol dehydrogenase family)
MLQKGTFRDETVIITGRGTGLVLAIALVLAELGANVVASLGQTQGSGLNRAGTDSCL